MLRHYPLVARRLGLLPCALDPGLANPLSKPPCWYPLLCLAKIEKSMDMTRIQRKSLKNSRRSREWAIGVYLCDRLPRPYDTFGFQAPCLGYACMDLFWCCPM